jgi:hypothetical protein
MKMKLIYLNRTESEPIGSKSVTEDSAIVDEVIHDFGEDARLSIEPSFRFLKVVIWSHIKDSPKKSDLDPYHLVFMVEFPIDLEYQSLGHNLIFDYLEADLEELARILLVPKIHQGQRMITTPSGYGYLERTNFENTSLFLATPLSRDDTVGDALRIAAQLERYMSSLYEKVENLLSKVNSTVPPMGPD